MPSDEVKAENFTPVLVQRWKKNGIGWIECAPLYKDEADLDADILSQLNQQGFSLPRVKGWPRPKFRAHIATEIGKELLATKRAVLAPASPSLPPYIKGEEVEDQVGLLGLHLPPKPAPPTVKRIDWNKVTDFTREVPAKPELPIPHRMNWDKIPSPSNPNLTPLGKLKLQDPDQRPPKPAPETPKNLERNQVTTGVAEVPAKPASLAHHKVHWTRLQNFAEGQVDIPIKLQPDDQVLRYTRDAQSDQAEISTQQKICGEECLEKGIDWDKVTSIMDETKELLDKLHRDDDTGSSAGPDDHLDSLPTIGMASGKTEPARIQLKDPLDVAGRPDSSENSEGEGSKSGSHDTSLDTRFAPTLCQSYGIWKQAKEEGVERTLAAIGLWLRGELPDSPPKRRKNLARNIRDTLVALDAEERARDFGTPNLLDAEAARRYGMSNAEFSNIMQQIREAGVEKTYADIINWLRENVNLSSRTVKSLASAIALRFESVESKERVAELSAEFGNSSTTNQKPEQSTTLSTETIQHPALLPLDRKRPLSAHAPDDTGVKTDHDHDSKRIATLIKVRPDETGIEEVRFSRSTSAPV